MKIIVDAMGGDFAPDEIVKGTSDAASRRPGNEIVLVGDTEAIKKSAQKQGLSLDGITLYHTDGTVTMEDDPGEAFRNKGDSSLCTGLRMLKEDADAFVSAGNTGALMFCSTMTVRRLPGVDRPCLAAVLPFEKPLMILDSGANLDVKPEYFEQWAILGSIYYKNLYGCENVRVGLLNNGAEETKGTELQTASYQLLKNTERIDFAGNIEGRYISSGRCEILLCDGFSGNIVLKYTEGISKMFMGYLKDIFYKNAKNKAAALMLRRDLNEFRERFNYRNYGGAPIIGLSKPVFKAHGNSDAKAFSNAVVQAVDFAGALPEDELHSAAEYLRTRKQERKNKNV